MKAIVYRTYGPPDVLKLEETRTPDPGPKEVMVRVHAASLNPLDWHIMRGVPGLIRLMFGVRKPKLPRLGRDLAGVVEAVGNEVRRFKPGDPVFGTGRGAFAEYACAPEAELALKPDAIRFEQAAAIPIAGLTALQALRDKAHTQPGQRLLINGAAGGVGTFAVQIGKAFGAHVTAVCSARNASLVQSLGAAEVIDYTREDFTRGTARFDAILECVGNHPFRECRQVLNRGGVWIGVGGGGPDRTSAGLLADMARDTWASWRSEAGKASMIAKSNPADLEAIAAMLTAGKVHPVIDLEYPLADLPAAMRYVEDGHARGKVIIRMQPPD